MSGVKLDTTKLDQLLATIPGNRDKVLYQAASAIEQQAKNNVRQWSLIDTGAMVNSIIAQQDRPGLWQVGDFGDYSERKTVGGMTHYAVYWELGHRNIFLRRYVRKPFLEPALRYVQARFQQMLTQGLFK